MSRLDYVSTLNMELLLIILLEKITNNSTQFYISLFRVLLIELSRILNHLLSITTHIIDIGAITPLL